MIDVFVNENIELAIIGNIILYGNESYVIASSIIEKGDFYFKELADVWCAMGTIYGKGQDIDFNILDLELQKHSWYSMEKLTRFTDNPCNSHLLEQNCIALVEIADKRNYHQRTAQAAKMLENGASLHEAKAMVEGAVPREPDRIIHVSQAVDGIKLCDPFTDNPGSGIPTGIKELDDWLTFDGVKRGAITVIAAESSKGKSTLASQIGDFAAISGLTVLDITMEDDEVSRAGRSISRLSKIPNERIQKGDIAPSEMERFEMAKKELSGLNIHYIPRIPRSSNHLCGMVRKFNSTKPVDLLIIDYVQLIPGGKRSKTEVIDESVMDLARLATDNPSMAIILVSQFNRTESGNRPTMDSLYHSAFIGQASHTILLIWQPRIELDPLNEASLCRHVIVAKQKNGKTGDVILGWNGDLVQFTSPDRSHIAAYLEAIDSLKSNRRKNAFSSRRNN